MVSTLYHRYLEFPSLPTTDPVFRDELILRGWSLRTIRQNKRSHEEFLDFADPIESFSFSWQSPHNSTLRYFMYGDRVRAEFSCPRLINDSSINVDLVTPDQAIDALYISRDMLPDLIPDIHFSDLGFIKFARLDFAIDVVSGIYRPAVLAAGGGYRHPGSKNKEQIFPHTGSKVWNARNSYRTYCKASHLCDTLSLSQRLEFEVLLKDYKSAGVVRNEFMDRSIKGLTIESVINGYLNFVLRFEQGYRGNTKITVGGLDRILMDLYMMPISSQRRSSMHSFVDIYSKYGEQGTRELMTLRTFQRKKRQFLDMGLVLTDLSDVYAELDYAPILKELRSENL